MHFDSIREPILQSIERRVAGHICHHACIYYMAAFDQCLLKHRRLCE